MTKMIKWDQLSFEEQALTVLTQGVLNRKGCRVFVDIDHYMDYLKDKYEVVTIYDLIKENAGSFEGIVVYDLSETDVSVNMAATLLAKYDYLAVPRKLLTKVVDLTGLKVIRDLSDIKGDDAERQRIIFNEVRDSLSNEGLVHQVVGENRFLIFLRDFSIKKRYACIHTGENPSDLAFRDEVLSFLKPVSPIYGWNLDEIAFIKSISTYGHYQIPTDWSSNHSYFEDADGKISQKIKRTPIRKGKHYLAIVVSDGDNIQWLEREFAHNSTFGERQRSKLDYKMSWTLSPSLLRLCPEAVESFYSSKKHDHFVSSVSGIGYSNIMAFKGEYLPEFVKMSIEAMEKEGLDVITLLDNINNLKDPKYVDERLSLYAKDERIKGGVYELDPDRYSSGAGRIYWAKGKPFVSVRFSLWEVGVDRGEASKEFLDDYIARINAMKPDIHGENGYTIVNFHPWSMTIKDLDYIVERLEDHIEIVYADELIDLIRENVRKDG